MTTSTLVKPALPQGAYKENISINETLNEMNRRIEQLATTVSPRPVQSSVQANNR